jgi:spore coat protein A, manganese oxidase
LFQLIIKKEVVKMRYRNNFNVFFATFFMFLVSVSGAVALDTAPQNSPPIEASKIPKFVDPLPILDVTGAKNGTIQTIVAGTDQIPVEMQEFKARMLPTGFNPGGSYDGTWVWGYVKGGTDTSVTRDTFTGPVVVATRGIPTEIKYTNNLGSTDTTNVKAYNYATDQSIHWANPDNVLKYVPGVIPIAPWVGNPAHYTGPIPAAVHLHGQRTRQPLMEDRNHGF